MKEFLSVQATLALLFICSLGVIPSGCIPTNPIGTPTDTNIYHKIPNWIVSDTAGKIGYPNSKSYDINDDGVNDFVITNITPGSFGYFQADIFVLNQTLVKGRANQLTIDSLSVYTYYIPELVSGSLISAQDSFYNTNTTRLSNLFGWNVTFIGNKTGSHYTGFKIMLNGQPHYAWVKFTETYTFDAYVTPALFTGSVRINESGFCKLANIPIKTGVW